MRLVIYLILMSQKESMINILHFNRFNRRIIKKTKIS